MDKDDAYYKKAQQVRRLIKNDEPKTNSFEPAAVSGDDFDL